MNHRQAVQATLEREPADFVPGWTFFSTPQAEALLLPDVGGDDGDDRQIALARATRSSVLSVSGNLQGRLLEDHGDWMLIELDNGTRRRIVSEPEWFYETLSRPLDGAPDVDQMHLPTMDDYAPHWSAVARSVARFHDEGYYVRGTLDGFYAGIWEHCRQADEFFLDLAEDSELARGLVDAWGEFVCACAERLIECGVDAIWWTDDLGSNTGPVMSPACYRRYFQPWHKRAAEIAHRRGRMAMMHSHGNINLLLPDIVDTGIDLLDPVGHSDGMNLAELKERYGDSLCFSGGISRFIAGMTVDELRAHLEEVYRTGTRGSGFLPAEEGGVPRDMAPEAFSAYREIRAELSLRYGRGTPE